MVIERRPTGIRRLSEAWRSRGLRVGFVPTMGALHEGHVSLVRRALREDDRVVVSVFVNPAQFGPKEDFSRYPRPFTADARMCRAAGAHAVYHPSVADMYPPGFSSNIEVAGLSGLLCGAFRPGHFRGVATVVLKLLEQVRPSSLYLGEKDFQQLAVIRTMVRDLDLPVRVVGCPTVRERDGLALSSRNAYLSPQERALAPRLNRALRAGAAAARGGASAARVRALMRREALKIPGVRIDYMEIVDSASLRTPPCLKGKLRLLGALRIGNTRLIDNIPVIV